ncbi:MAG: Dephospho-CoA kinase [Bryobacterales bacterium]|nr:Dephospho-CoA kinase [Bryobacterales bacterium]
MLKVGLTGGLASGKSFVGKALMEMGCVLIQADQLGHEVLLPGGAAYSDVVQRFGTGILSSDGLIDRKLLASEVFSNPERLAQLNAIVHPAVFRREDELIAASAPDGIVVVEAAILIETGSYQRFDKLVLAVCTMEQQIERAMHRDGAALKDVLARLNRQLSLDEKRKYADFVVDTSGTKEDTLRQTADLYNGLRRLAEAKIEQ